MSALGQRLRALFSKRGHKPAANAQNRPWKPPLDPENPYRRLYTDTPSFEALARRAREAEEGQKPKK